MITNAPINITQNSFVSLARIDMVVSSHFGVHQQTTIRFSDDSIRKVVLTSICSESYRKVLIFPHKKHMILTLSFTLFVFSSGFMTTVVSYFGIKTGYSEREAEATVAFIYKAFFCVSNL